MPVWLYIAGGSLAAGFLGGWAVCDAFADAALVKGYERLIEVKDKNREEMRAQATEFETFKQNLQPATETVREKIREYYRDAPPVPAECAWSPDVLSLLENHRAVANRAAGGDFGGAVPGHTADPGQ